MKSKKRKNPVRKTKPRTPPALVTTSKSAFVRSLPVDMPAAEVVKRAKEARLVLTAKHVHVIRSLAKRKTRVVGGGRYHITVPTPRKAPGALQAHDERGFRTFALNVGLVRARQIIDELAAITA